ncbi:MAG: ABC transporter substrate-binding protein [Pseudomonadota bacterium]|nr:ABC transporter substrate-binding protein [Pseudomonadota bacterium]
MFALVRRRIAAATIALACAGAPASLSALEVTDVLGRTVDVPAPAQRVLLGFYFEDFLAIAGPGAFDRVVAISREAWEGWRNSQWKTYVRAIPRLETLVDVGEVDAGTFNIEAAVAARPDVAIIAAWQYSAMGESIARLEAAGTKVIVADYNAQKVERHVASTLAIGQVMGTETRARELADTYAAAVAEVERRVAAAGKPEKRVYIEIGNKGAGEYSNSYSGTMWGGVIDTAGGINIANGHITGAKPLSPEYVIAANPQVVFLAGSWWTNRDSAVLMGFGVDPDETRARMRPYLERAGWSSLDAVKTGEVHALYHGGARTLYDHAFLQYIAKVLWPEAFADIDPVETQRRYYDRWLPIVADGAFMVRIAP